MFLAEERCQMHSLPPVHEMERAYLARDADYDGVFFVAVRTTGIFCLPSCSARNPLPQNVEYFATAHDALDAGYRPCKRCDPTNIQHVPPAWIAQLIDEVDRDGATRITDADLRERGLDPVRVRRYFLQRFGMTFHAYCRGRRMGQALVQIRDGVALDEVTLGNGYDSHSGFRAMFGKTFGLPPGKAQTTDCIQVGMVETPLGSMVLGATSEGLCLAEFANRRTLDAQLAALRRLFRCAIVPGNTAYLDQTRDELARYFAGILRQFSVPLVYPGTLFQRAVWDVLRLLPYGTTRSYESVAWELGQPRASRAVGTANGLNRIAILIPCHRLLNKNGRLGGYGGGLWRKQALLDLEHGKRTFAHRESMTAQQFHRPAR
jgi:AraC family transcriptional regulator, regulatory protein of adaptative response / methylated-DNA-[protein]-cysteine methyltransferase